VLAEGFVVKGSGYFWVSLGERERHAVSHTRILWHFGGICVPFAVGARLPASAGGNRTQVKAQKGTISCIASGVQRLLCDGQNMACFVVGHKDDQP
jgi:hypothetical protein